MNEKLSLVTLLAITSLVTSCGSGKSDNDDSFTITTKTFSVPIALKKQVATRDCVELFRTGEQARFSVPRFLDGFLTQSELNITDQLQGRFVRSPNRDPISEMTYGQETAIVKKAVVKNRIATPIESTARTVIRKSGKALDVCPSSKSYDAFTYESAGINISNTISKTHKKIADLGVVLEPIKVNISPTIYEEYVYKKKVIAKIYRADNASYNGQTKEITFLPQSKDYQTDVNKVPFWQIPMVGAHEYGHHVFGSVVYSELSSKVNNSIHGCFNNHEHTSLIMGGTADARNNKASFALGAMNEGFADLIAKYTLDEEESSMTNVVCFENNRDPRSSSFGDGTEKVFNSKTTKIMDSDAIIVSSRDCNKPNLQSIHHVGAYFAYSANKIIESYSNDNKTSLKILLAYSNSIAQTHSIVSDSKASDYINVNLIMLMSTAHRVSEKPAEELSCDLINEIFPDSKTDYCGVIRDQLIKMAADGSEVPLIPKLSLN